MLAAFSGDLLLIDDQGVLQMRGSQNCKAPSSVSLQEASIQWQARSWPEWMES